MQRVPFPLRKKPLSQIVLTAFCVVASPLVYAQSSQSATDLGSVQASANGGGTAPATSKKKVDSAITQAPTQTSLKATQPQSTIDSHYIANNMAPTANYSEIIQISPSVNTISPNGAGLMESKGTSIRGFQDGQYNITYDGIPFGDSNDFTHHSTSFFTSQNIANVTVDRGPGDAAQLGFATFGGTVAIQSQEPSLTPLVSVLGSYGTDATWNTGAAFHTGTLKELGDARAVFGYSHTNSNGQLTNAAQRRENVYFKLEKPIGDNTLLTLYANYSRIHQNVPIGATAAQIAKYGPNFALSGDGSSQNFYGYNFDRISTDMEYIDLKTRLAGWKFDNKAYTYAYYHDGFNGLDPNGETPNGTIYGANDVPGQQMANNYRAFGDILTAEKALGPGTLQLGAWFTHQTNFRDKLEVDDSLNFAQESVDYHIDNTFTTVEPYVQYAWKVGHGLTFTPGVKYVYFNRNYDAAINQSTGQPLNTSHSWNKVLPSFNLHEQINPHWSAYLQYAQGFLAPNVNVFYVNNPGTSGQPSPEQTDNYQLGTTWKTDRLVVSGDLYYINFKNAVTSRTVGGNTIFSNAGGATYKGIEADATYYAGYGFSLYGNLTFNSAKDKQTGDWMPNAPRQTAALGLIYQRGPVYGSVISKLVGHQYGDTGNTQPIGAFLLTNLSAAYTIKHIGTWMHDTRIGLEVNNLFNRRNIDGLAGYTGGANTPLYWTIPGRSVVATLSTDF